MLSEASKKIWSIQPLSEVNFVFDQLREAPSHQRVILFPKNDSWENHLLEGELKYHLFENFTDGHNCWKELKKKEIPLQKELGSTSYKNEKKQRGSWANIVNHLLVPLDDIIHTHQDFNIQKISAISGFPYDVKNAYISLNTFFALHSAWQRYQRGVKIEGFRIYPYYGVYIPIRQDPVMAFKKLLRQIDLRGKTCCEVGVGSGILTMMAARAGAKCFGTDINPMAILSANASIKANGLSGIELKEVSFFLPGKYDFVICNPPWIPGAINGLLDQAIYFTDHFFNELLSLLPNHLAEQGRAYLIFSNFAENNHLVPTKFIEQEAERFGLHCKILFAITPNHKKYKANKNKNEKTYLYEVSKSKIPSANQIV